MFCHAFESQRGPQDSWVHQIFHRARPNFKRPIKILNFVLPISGAHHYFGTGIALQFSRIPQPAFSIKWERNTNASIMQHKLTVGFEVLFLPSTLKCIICLAERVTSTQKAYHRFEQNDFYFLAEIAVYLDEA